MGLGLPFEQSRGEGFGDARLVGRVVEIGWVAAVVGLAGGDLDGDGGAGHAVDFREGSAAQHDGQAGVEQG